MTKIKDLLFKQQKTLGIVIIFLFLSLVSFSFDSHEIRLFWSVYPTVAVLLVLIIAITAFIWLRIEKHKTRLLIEDMKKGATQNPQNDKIKELSTRQLQVFEMILTGKSNKEIISNLNIEMSTLKSHINQIYRILGIKNRKEVKSFEK